MSTLTCRLTFLASFPSRRPDEPLKSILTLATILLLQSAWMRSSATCPNAATAEPTQVVSASIESSRCHRARSLFSWEGLRTKMASKELVDYTRLKPFKISICSVEPVCTHNTAVFILYFLNDFEFQLLCEQGICVPRLNQSDEILFGWIAVWKVRSFTFYSSWSGWSLPCVGFWSEAWADRCILLADALLLLDDVLGLVVGAELLLVSLRAEITPEDADVLVGWGGTRERRAGDALHRANDLLEVAHSSIERCLRFTKLSVLIRRVVSNLIRSICSSKAALERLWRYLPDHYLVCFIFDDLVRIAADYRWRDNHASIWISEANNLTESRQLKSIPKSIQHLLHAHVLRDQNLDLVRSKSRFEWKMHLI